MTDIVLHKLDEVHLQVKADMGIKRELAEALKFRAKNYKFHPKVKNKMWDGYIKLINGFTGVGYVGLESNIIKFAKESGYSITPLEKNKIKIPDDFGFTLADRYSPNSKFEKRDYQNTAIVECLRRKRMLLLSPTSSGKSFTIYLIARYLQEELGKKILIIVPNVGLVNQFESDLKEYSKNSIDIHKIYSGQEKDRDADYTITTWQSVLKMPVSWYQKFDVVFGDEAHGFGAKSLVSIMEKFKKVEYRYGFTGTLDDEESQANPLTIQGLFGEILQVVTTKELIDDGTLSNFKIECIVLKYPIEDVKEFSKIMRDKKNKTPPYKKEMDYIISSDKRNNFVTNLATSFKDKNIIVFVQYIDDHGDILYEKLKDRNTHNVYYIHGSVSGDERERIRKDMEKSRGNILLASYGTTSTGVNIVNLDYIIFAHPSKGKIRNLQSIGRVLRRGDNKTKGKLIDISDDLTVGKKKNFGLNHFEKRLALYMKEEFEYSIHTVNLKQE